MSFDLQRFPAQGRCRARFAAAGVLSLIALGARAEIGAVEVHQVLALEGSAEKVVALTLDACGGGYDADLIRFLTQQRIPATIFATKKWMDRQPAAVAELRAHPDLFDIEDHGERHVPAVLGPQRMVYGIRGSADVRQLKREVSAGAQAVRTLTGVAPTWYRGATGEYDREALTVISQLGFHVAGFSLNADDGARLSRRQILRRLSRVKPGDIIIAHMNRPASDTAEGLAEGLQALLEQGFRFVTLRGARVKYASDTARWLARSSAP
jgi:peptidoglycan/xylan/chitin deacetylase (PgdA/CDA1 family)